MVPKSVSNYATRVGIEIDYETYDDVTFIAPKGYIFSTEAHSRHIEDYPEMPAREMLNLIYIEKESQPWHRV